MQTYLKVWKLKPTTVAIDGVKGWELEPTTVAIDIVNGRELQRTTADIDDNEQAVLSGEKTEVAG